ncbi:nucleoside deaminase [Haloferula sp.]|uniref:nucleoside deaminase n=1 Tax=Haloferula sp. TaxID=2497595 RepID=UPI00329D9F38
MLLRTMTSESRFMLRAIELARKGMLAGDGGPFGAVVVRNGEIIGEGWNRVLLNNDPTAHGEVTAIRDACTKINDFRLSGCEIHTTGQPCPMCLGAIHWARIDRIYYGFSIEDAATAGFDDQDFYSELSLPAEQRSIPSLQSEAKEALQLLEDYKSLPGTKDY